MHNDYPLAPERMSVRVDMLSEKQLEIKRHYDMSRHSNSTKLIPSLLPKKHYTVHFVNLQFYLRHGMNLTKVHKVLEFQQSRWLEGYIGMNSGPRAATQNE